MRYSHPGEGVLIIEPLDLLTAVFDRRSGATHLLAEPAPALLAALEAGPAALDELKARLTQRFEIEGADETALAARLRELLDVGLIEAR